MTISYELVDNIDASNNLWKQFREIVEGEGWKSDDHSVMVLTPQIDSTRSVFAKDQNGNFIGCVVWNEYDGMAFIGFYLMKEEHRGKGVGPVIWKRALSHMPKDYTIGLRAVPYMAPRYKKLDTPVEGQYLNEFSAHWKVIDNIFSKYERKDAQMHLLDKANQKVLDFDQKITKRDRSDFLKRFHELDFTLGSYILDDEGNVVAYAAITSTSTEDSHMFKLAPIYASTLENALAVSRPLLEFAGKRDEEAVILFHILTDSRGETELLPLLEKNNVQSRLTGVTLFSKEYENPMDFKNVYVANNNSCHFDA